MRLKKNIKNTIKTLGLLFGLALIFRLWGIWHGFPYILHPDEPAVIRSALGLRFGDMNPHHFDWPHLQIYISAVVNELFIKVRALVNVLSLRSFLEPYFPLLWDDPTVFYLVSRIITAFMGAGTVAVLFLVGKKLFSRKVGIAAALFLAFNTSHLWESRVATVDVPMVFWLVLSLYFAVNISRKGNLRDYLLAGLFAGFATSTKYNGGMAVVTILTAYFGYLFSQERFKDREMIFNQTKVLLFSALASLGGFFLGTPYALLDWETFVRNDSPAGAFWQFARTSRDVGTTYIEQFRTRLFEVVPEAQGVLLTAVSVLGIFYSAVKRKPEYLLLVPFPVLYFFYVARFSYFQPHFLIPLYPYLALLGAKLLEDLSSGILSRWKSKPSFLNVGVGFMILSFVVLISPLVTSFEESVVRARPDTRALATDWVNENIEDGVRILMGSDYEPILREKEGPEDTDHGYYLLNWGYRLQEVPLSENYIEEVNKMDVDYIILGGFDLDEAYEEAEWDKDKTTKLGWLSFGDVELIKRFDPNGNYGPTVLIFKVPEEK